MTTSFRSYLCREAARHRAGCADILAKSYIMNILIRPTLMKAHLAAVQPCSGCVIYGDRPIRISANRYREHVRDAPRQEADLLAGAHEYGVAHTPDRLDRSPIRCLRHPDSLLISTGADARHRHGTRRSETPGSGHGGRGDLPPTRKGQSGWPNDSRSPSSTTTS